MRKSIAGTLLASLNPSGHTKLPVSQPVSQLSESDDFPNQSVVQQLDEENAQMFDALAQSTLIDIKPALQSVSVSQIETYVNPELPSDTFLGMYVALDALVIDPHQPRKYLPADLRAQLTRGAVDPVTAMKLLIERTAQGDRVAHGYLEQLQELARNIRDVGLQQPLRVSEEHDRDHQPVFRIVDGERRYWAHVWLAVVGAATEPAAQPIHIPVLLHNTRATADEIQRAQWAANLHREDIPVVDFAEIIWQVREDYFSRLSIDRARTINTLGAAAEGLSLSDIAALLTCQEVERITGRKLKRSSLYHYIAIAEKLKAMPKALARAHGLSLRQLQVVVRLSEAQQTEAILSMIATHQADKSTQAQTSSLLGTPGRPGRPTSLQRSVNMCINLAGALQKLSSRALGRHAPEEQQTLLSELDAAAAEIDRTRRLIKTQLGT